MKQELRKETTKHTNVVLSGKLCDNPLCYAYSDGYGCREKEVVRKKNLECELNL